MVPAAPPLLLMITHCPRALDNSACSARAIRSVLPPGGKGTTMVTGRNGKFCAAAVDTAPARMAAASESLRIGISSLKLILLELRLLGQTIAVILRRERAKRASKDAAPKLRPSPFEAR